MIVATDVPADSPCSPLEATLAEPQQQVMASRDSAVAVLHSDGALLAAAGLGIGGGQHVTPKHDSNSSEGQRLPAPVQPAGNGCLQMADADFMMFRHKTQPCKKVYTHDWAPCPFYHRHPAECARRRSPLTHPYTAVLCPEMDKLGKCPRGDACAMRHSVFEYALHPDRFRTKVCINGESCTRTVCFYTHTPQELRRVSSTASSTQPKPPAFSGAAAVPSSSGGEAAGLGAPPGAALFVESGTAAGGQYNRTKPPMLPVVRVPARQGGGMHAAQQGPLSSNTSDSTTCGISWFGSSPLTPATPSSGMGLEGTCQPPPPPPLAQGTTQQQQQQQQAPMLRCQPQPQSAPFRTAQQGYGGSQQGQQHMQRVPEISLLPSGPGSVSAGPDITVQHMQAQLSGLGVSAATAAIYAKQGSSRCAADAAAVMRPQPYTCNAGAQVLQHTGPLVACGVQRQPVQQQPLGGAGLGFGGAIAAEQPADGSTLGLVVCSGSRGQVPARLGVHVMLGMQQQQGQQQGRVAYIQQQPFQPMLQQQQQYIVPVGAQAAQQLQQQLNSSRVLQLLQQQGMAGPAAGLSYDSTGGGVSGVMPAGQFPPGIFYQQGYMTNAGAAGAAATDSSLPPVPLQQPVFLRPQQQQHLMMVPAGVSGGVGGIAGQGVQAIPGMGMGGKPGALAMQYGPSGF